ncbi:MAG TPA: HPF/RaiA family ribosome-associated protein [Candidatus Paceibacterota bacterium]
MMNYNVVGLNVELTPEIYAHVEKQIQLHVEKFLHGDTAAKLDVDLEYVQGAAGPKYQTRLTCARGKEVYRAQASGSTLHESIDIAAGELNRELSHAKDKKMRLWRVGAGKIKNLFKGL